MTIASEVVCPKIHPISGARKITLEGVYFFLIQVSQSSGQKSWLA
ncbi:hypothetical protein [Nibribacter ruber]|nr:hypothetical protein [Nibribacter ruber]